jgi:hypothetical protein
MFRVTTKGILCILILITCESHTAMESTHLGEKCIYQIHKINIGVIKTPNSYV